VRSWAGSRGRAWAIGSDGYGRLKFRCQVDRELRVDCPAVHSPNHFLIFDADWADEVTRSKFLKLWGKPVDWKCETEFFYEN